MPTTHRQATEATENTMLSSTLISPAAGSVAAIVGTPPTAQRSAGDGSPAPESFATVLNLASSATASPPPTPTAAGRDAARTEAAAGDATNADKAHAAAADSATAARAAAQRKSAAAAASAVNEKSAASGLPTASTPAETGAGAGATPAQDTHSADRTGDPADPASDANSLLASLLGGTPAATDREAGKATLKSAGSAGVTAATGRSGSGKAQAAEAAADVTAGASRRGETGADALVSAAGRDTASRPAGAAAAAAAAPAAAPALPSAAAPLSAPSPALSAAAPGTGSPMVAEARLQASPGSAEFAPALGAQLNVFLRDGVQHARLQLHPVELGPLTVQIQLDGATAQVRLAAEHPLTRQALEQALPTLAGSLRESGLTLTGGGVFEQPANPQRQQDGERTGGERTAGGGVGGGKPAPAESAPLRAVVARRGVVDLVA